MPLNTKDNSSADISQAATPSWMIDMHIKDHDDARWIFYETSDKDSPFWAFTLLDLFGAEEFSPVAIREKLFSFLWVTDTPNHAKFALRKINSFYTEAINFLETVLYRQMPIGLKTRKWESIEDFVVGIWSHTNRQNSGAYSLMFCAIIKTMFIEAELDEDRSVDELDTDMTSLLAKIKDLPGLKIKKTKEVLTNYIDYELDGLYAGKMENRPKSRNSIKTKMIYNRKYNKLSKFKDLLALRFELDPSKGETGYIHTILKIKAHLYGDKTVDFEIKWNILSPHSIDTLKANKINVIIKSPKWAWSLQYEDAKFVWWQVKIKWPNGKSTKVIQPEVQFVLPNNKNEAWFSSHKVYELKKVLSANVRLFGAITLWNLGYILAHFDAWFDKRSLLNHLLYPQDGKTKPFLCILQAKSKTTGRTKTYLSTTDVYEESMNENVFSLRDIYPHFPPILNKQWSTTGDIQSLVHTTVENIIKRSK